MIRDESLEEVFMSLSGELPGVWSMGYKVKRESFRLLSTITPLFSCLFLIGVLIRNTWRTVSLLTGL